MKINTTRLAAMALAAFSLIVGANEASCVNGQPTVYFTETEHNVQVWAAGGNQRLIISEVPGRDVGVLGVFGDFSQPEMADVFHFASRYDLARFRAVHVTMAPTNRFADNDPWILPRSTESLNFSTNYLGDVGARRLAETLPQLTNLRSLLIPNNGIHTDAAQAIIHALPPSVIRLNLSGNPVAQHVRQRVANLAPGRQFFEDLRITLPQH